MQEHLAQEERVATGFGSDRFNEGNGHLMPRDGFEQLRHRLARKTRERDALDLNFTPQRNEGVSERVLAVELHVPVRTEEKHRVAREEAREVAQENKRGPVR